MAGDKTHRDYSLVWVTIGTIAFAAIAIYIIQSVLP